MTYHNDTSASPDGPATTTDAVRASVIIPTYNGVDLTRACVEALIAAGWHDCDELIIVDNASRDATREFLATLDGSVTVILNKINRNFAGACNQGVAAARGKYVVLLNNDTEVKIGWLDALIATAEQEGADVVGSRLLYPDGMIQHAGVGVEQGVFPRHLNRYLAGNSPRVATSFACQIVTGACMLVRHDRWDAVNGLDERFRNGCEDIDLCLRLRASGSSVWYCADSVVTHHESLSAGRNDHDDANAALFFAMHGHSLLGDRIVGDRIVMLADPSLPWRRETAVTTSVIVTLDHDVATSRRCLESIFVEGLPADAELVIVDNASTDGTVEYCDELAGRARILRSDNYVHYSGACRLGMAHSLGAKLIFLHSDTEVTEGWLEALATPLDDPRIGVVGSRLLRPDGRVQHAGISFDDDRVGFNIHAGAAGDDPAVMTGRTMQAVSGACFAIDREVFVRTVFDLAYRNGCEDLELCLRAAQLGVAIWYEPSCVVIHHDIQGPDRGDHTAANLQLFQNRWSNVVVPDVDTFARASMTTPRAWSASYEATSIVVHNSTDTVPLATAFGAAVERSTGHTFVLTTTHTSNVSIAAAKARLNETDIVTGARPDAAMVWRGNGAETALALTRGALNLVGGLDTQLTTGSAAIADLARRCQLAGILIADAQPNPDVPPVTARLVGASFAGSPDSGRWKERWHLCAARPAARTVTSWLPLLPQRAFQPDDLAFATRAHVVLLTWRADETDAFTSAARALLTGLGPTDDVTLLVRVGTDANAYAAFEHAAVGIADEAMPDIVIVDAEIDYEAALCAAANVVVIPDAGWYSLHSLALTYDARPLMPDHALRFLATINEARSAA